MDKQLKNKINPDVQYKVLSVLHQNPSLSQRELAKKLKISLGGINYCLKSLVDVGHIKITNFNNNPNKSNYLYLLTPQGVLQKSSLTAEFLKRKLIEYNELKKEIESIQSEMMGQ